MKQFGKLIIFGSGETSETGKAIFRNFFLQALKLQKVAVLETPAGFQPNSAQVAQEVGQVIKSSAPDLVKEVSVIPVRRKGTRFSPDNPEILKPLEEADFIFLGPGSPTYALRQLKKSLALIKMGESWARGATLCFASAAAVIVGKYALPVYEIYKAGTDLYWEGGLNLLAEMGFDLTAVPHWNNNEGGKKLDTNRCFMGKERFNELRKLLGKETAFFGIDENTAVIFSPQEKFFTVEGRGTATLLIGGKAIAFKKHHAYDWRSLIERRVIERKYPGLGKEKPKQKAGLSQNPEDLPVKLKKLFEERERARQKGDFKRADEIRRIFEESGYEIRDAGTKPLVFKKDRN